VGANSRYKFSIGKVLVQRHICVGNFLHAAVQPYICSETEFKKISAENFVVHRSDPWGMRRKENWLPYAGNWGTMHNVWILGLLPNRKAAGVHQ
jgi:hypothetical protein